MGILGTRAKRRTTTSIPKNNINTNILPKERKRCDSVYPTTGRTYTRETRVIQRELSSIILGIVQRTRYSGVTTKEDIHALVKPEVTTLYAQLAWLSKYGCSVNAPVKVLIANLVQSIKRDVRTPGIQTNAQAKKSLATFDTRNQKNSGAHKTSVANIVVDVIWNIVKHQHRR